MADEALEVGRRLRRREFLIAGAGAGLALASPINFAGLARARALPPATGAKFAYGVASGIPSQGAITLWTRLKGLDRTSSLRVEVATDSSFPRMSSTGRRPRGGEPGLHGSRPGRRPEARRTSTTTASRPRTRIACRALPHASPAPTRTSSSGSASTRARAMRPATTRPRRRSPRRRTSTSSSASATTSTSTTTTTGRRDESTRPEPTTTATSRRSPSTAQKYRFYQTDKNLQDHARGIPFVVVWDDHEVEDNYAGTHPDSASTDPAHFENNNSYARRVPFGERRKNGYKAFFEAMPRIQLHANANRLYGSFRLGKLAELFLTDERQYRDPAAV